MIVPLISVINPYLYIVHVSKFLTVIFDAPHKLTLGSFLFNLFLPMPHQILSFVLYEWGTFLRVMFSCMMLPLPKILSIFLCSLWKTFVKQSSLDSSIYSTNICRVDRCSKILSNETEHKEQESLLRLKICLMTELWNPRLINNSFSCFPSNVCITLMRSLSHYISMLMCQYSHQIGNSSRKGNISQFLQF